ncbi:HERV-H LTR-associating protein 2 [Chanodichthys erythropterus]|uniref:HERV-H LTR-associating protein 2 n=1 Tax=Chanodichthys erythropterus TaxID=933992 RepID=UPI00351F7299
MKLVILLWILPVTLGDIYVTCIYSEECVLPCTATHLDIIHWYKDSKAVHSFFHDKDQLDHQSEDYKGRTSLFPESEIKNGNVSLLLKNISVQDEGRYRCYAADETKNDEKYVSVSVEAPAKSVDITLKGDTVICTTSGVYPKPLISWSSDPPAKEPLNTFQQTEEKLFNVTSELKVGNISNTYKYTCSITTKDITQTATLEKQASEIEGINGIIIPVIVIVAIVIVIGTGIGIFVVRKKKKSQKECSEDSEEMKNLNRISENGATLLPWQPSTFQHYNDCDI